MAGKENKPLRRRMNVPERRREPTAPPPERITTPERTPEKVPA